MLRIKYLKSGAVSEESMHLQIMKYVSVHPQLAKFKRFILHFPNEGKRSYSYGKLMQSMGLRKGVSDLFITVPRHNFGGAWIELKSADGKVSPEQVAFLEDMKTQNYYTSVCRSFDEALEVIGWYFNIKID